MLRPREKCGEGCARGAACGRGWWRGRRSGGAAAGESNTPTRRRENLAAQHKPAPAAGCEDPRHPKRVAAARVKRPLPRTRAKPPAPRLTARAATRTRRTRPAALRPPARSPFCPRARGSARAGVLRGALRLSCAWPPLVLAAAGARPHQRRAARAERLIIGGTARQSCSERLHGVARQRHARATRSSCGAERASGARPLLIEHSPASFGRAGRPPATALCLPQHPPHTAQLPPSVL
jgi:hypothetical protein